MNNIPDRFSEVASEYARYRPTYPAALYEYVLAAVRERGCAWDAGTGSGQVASELARAFQSVVATDISGAQLTHAIQKPNITYHTLRAEESGIPSGSVDLITVAQAIHWFDQDRFAKEVSRVARQDGVLAVWGYGLPGISQQVDAQIHHLYDEILAGYWDPQRALIDREYRDLEFPFAEIPGNKFFMDKMYTAASLTGYLRTWSAVTKFIRKNGEDPVSLIEPEIVRLSGDKPIYARTPVFLRMWRVHG